jgi:hypothetical protein
LSGCVPQLPILAVCVSRCAISIKENRPDGIPPDDQI